MIRKLPPTKSNLFKLQKELKFAREGYELLDRKREVLIMELMQVIHTIKNLQRRLAAALEEAYATFRRAYVEMGSEEIERANYAYLEPLELSLIERSVMGVAIPEVHASRVPQSPDRFNGYVGFIRPGGGRVSRSAAAVAGVHPGESNLDTAGGGDTEDTAAGKRA